jgi:hypothetical protein
MMGLLDDLKQQAESVQTDDAEQRRVYLANMGLIEAAMGSAIAYFYELANQLKVVKPVSPHVYRVWGVGEFTRLNMTLAAANSRNKSLEGKDLPDYIEFIVEWQGAEPLRTICSAQSAAKHLKEQLWQYGCKLEEKVQAAADGKFIRAAITIAPVVPTRFRFDAVYETGKIRLNIRNLANLGEDQHVLSPAQCTPALCEELAKAMLGKPHQLAELLR